MYIYNKDDKSYTFSFDDIEIDGSISLNDEPNNNENNNLNNSGNTSSEINDENSENEDSYKHPYKKIEVIDGGNDLNISPVSDYIEIEKPKSEKKENIIIPENRNK